MTRRMSAPSVSPRLAQTHAITDAQALAVAARLPVAFAQVKEDPLIDAAALELATRHLDRPANVAMIASGGCTAAYLLTQPLKIANLTLIDANPAQLELSQKKINFLTTPPTSGETALHLLGHSQNLPDQATPALDYDGRFEHIFAIMRRHLDLAQTQDLLQLYSPQAQRDWLSQNPDFSNRLLAALDLTFSQKNLTTLFGPLATSNAIQPFSTHFHQRTIWSIQNQPCASNYFLQQFLTDCRGRPSAAPQWLREPWPADTSPQTQNSPQIQYQNMTTDLALADTPDRYDLIQLSNILDWLPPDDIANTLRIAHAALQPNGVLLVRQLNSRTDLDAHIARAGYTLLPDLAARLHLEDRSFFYRRLHIARKPGPDA